MKKTTLFLIIGQAFLLVALSVSSFTYAWFDARSRSVVVDTSAGSIKINTITTNVYKYTYNNIGTTENPIIDYNNDGSVVKTSGVTSTSSIDMNIFDPTLITISQDATLSSLNTNLVLEVVLNTTYTTKMNLVLNALKQTHTGTGLLASDYVHFTALTSSEYATYCENNSKTAAGDTNIYNNIKAFSEDTTNHPYTIFDCAQGHGTDTSATIKDGSNNYFSLVNTKPSEQKTYNFTFYINIEYDDNLTNGKWSSSSSVVEDYNLYSDSKIGNVYAMDMDYKFAITLNQA